MRTSRKELWRSFRHNLFLLVSMLGVLAPWFTHRHFPPVAPFGPPSREMSELVPAEQQPPRQQAGIAASPDSPSVGGCDASGVMTYSRGPAAKVKKSARRG